jgi:hypothetical protein
MIATPSGVKKEAREAKRDGREDMGNSIVELSLMGWQTAGHHGN